MDQRTTLEIIAPTVEEAITQGLEQLGLTADAVSVEVLDAGNKGLFGLGKPQVRVRLTVNTAGGEVKGQTETAPVVEPEAQPIEPQPITSIQTQAEPSSVIESESQLEDEALLDRTEVNHLQVVALA